MSEMFNTWINKPSEKSKKRYNGRLWEINWWYIPCSIGTRVTRVRPRNSIEVGPSP